MASPFGDATGLMAGVAEMWNPAKEYTRRPAEWIADKPKEYAWDVQRAIAESVRDNRYTAVPSCHESGKSWIASRISAWWVDSHPVGSAMVVTTAPTAAQVSSILWQEIGQVHDNAGLLGRITSAGYPIWKIGTREVGIGRKPADHQQSAFQGLHREFMLVVIDEACGVPKHLYDAIDSLIANENGRVLAIGNPDDPGAHFFRVCQPGEGWNVIQIDALRTPNFTAERVANYPLTRQLMEAEQIPYATEDVPVKLRPMLIDPSWVEERIHSFAGVGRSETPDDDALIRRTSSSSLFAAKVRGVFPSSSATGIIPLGWVQQAVNRWKDWQNDGMPDVLGRRVVGVDVARGTGEGDESCLAIRQGNVVRELVLFRNDDTTETANKAALYLNHPQAMTVVDVIGIGAGVYDLLRKWNQTGRITASCIPFNAAAQSNRRDRLGQFIFRNDRAAAWWNFRELLDPSRGSQIALPDDEMLMQELTAPGYDHYVGGRIKVEEKDEIRKRIGRSTDRADAVIQAFWVTGMPADYGTQEGVPYRDARPNDGVKRYANTPTFTEDDLFDLPGVGGPFGLVPAMGMLAGDDWDV